MLTYNDRCKDVPTNTSLPNFSIITFDVIPIRCCRSLMLKCCVASRLGLEDSKSRDELTSVAENMIKLNKPILPPEKVPMQIDDWTLHGIVKPMNGSNWQNDGYCMAFKSSMCTITNSIIDSMCLKGNENNRKRAMLLIKYGSALHFIAKQITYYSRLDPTLKMIEFRCNVIP